MELESLKQEEEDDAFYEHSNVERSEIDAAELIDQGEEAFVPSSVYSIDREYLPSTSFKRRPNQFACARCFKRFPQSKKRDRHELHCKDNGEKKQKVASKVCSYCNWNCPNNKLLQLHLQTYHKEAFDLGNNLSAVKREETNSESSLLQKEDEALEPKICNKCNRVFFNALNYLRHYKVDCTGTTVTNKPRRQTPKEADDVPKKRKAVEPSEILADFSHMYQRNPDSYKRGYFAIKFATEAAFRKPAKQDVLRNLAYKSAPKELSLGHVPPGSTAPPISAKTALSDHLVGNTRCSTTNTRQNSGPFQENFHRFLKPDPEPTSLVIPQTGHPLQNRKIFAHTRIRRLDSFGKFRWNFLKCADCSHEFDQLWKVGIHRMLAHLDCHPTTVLGRIQGLFNSERNFHTRSGLQWTILKLTQVIDEGNKERFATEELLTIEQMLRLHTPFDEETITKPDTPPTSVPEPYRIRPPNPLPKNYGQMVMGNKTVNLLKGVPKDYLSKITSLEKPELINVFAETPEKHGFNMSNVKEEVVALSSLGPLKIIKPPTSLPTHGGTKTIIVRRENGKINPSQAQIIIKPPE